MGGVAVSRPVDSIPDYPDCNGDFAGWDELNVRA